MKYRYSTLRCVLGQQIYVDIWQYLGIFFIMGIGADDIFVFSDAFVQSSYLPESISSDLEKRFAWAYRRASSAMLVTSATTFCAFAATASSTVPAIRGFGIFAGLLVRG